ncbi:unannotated protein [freshwater metagenome]|uniref:Unannotated protein n=1 Tax=freshwater metagenome TaxID=449393 RepID=A0A6J6SXQ6_9ZZZZ
MANIATIRMTPYMSAKSPILIVFPRNFSASGISGPWIVLALNRMSVRAVKTDSVPSVTMNGGSLKRVMRNPFIAPAKTAARIPRRMAMIGF